MKQQDNKSDASDRRLPPQNGALAAAALLAIAIFAIDAFTPLRIAIAVLYVIVVMLASVGGTPKRTFVVACTCVALTLIAYGAAPHAPLPESALLRMVVSLLAITVATVLAIRNQLTTAQLHQQVLMLRQARAALARSEAFLADAQRLCRTGSMAIRLPDRQMYWSAEAYRMLEYPPGQTPELAMLFARVHPDDAARFEETLAEALRCAGAPVDTELRLLMPDGALKYARFVGHVIDHSPLTAGGQPERGAVEYVAALVDISEAKLAQEALDRSRAELAHATRVTMLGQLAASIAHEISQPIAAVTANGDAALRWLKRAEPNVMEAYEAITSAIREAKRSSEIVTRIRAMAQRREPRSEPVEINAIIEESVELLKREIERSGAAIVLELDPHLPPTVGDRVQLQQVVINLMMNAMQAMEGTAERDRTLRLATGQDEDGRVIVSVHDSGVGIAAPDADRLFQAFHTTKEQGMGMGLSICRTIVEAHGGRIWAGPNQSDGRGATFQFALPLGEAQVTTV